MKIKILSHIKHDGKELQPGTVVDMLDDMAARLIAGGSAEASAEKQKHVPADSKQGKEK